MICSGVILLRFGLGLFFGMLVGIWIGWRARGAQYDLPHPLFVNTHGPTIGDHDSWRQ